MRNLKTVLIATAFLAAIFVLYTKVLAPAPENKGLSTTAASDAPAEKVQENDSSEEALANQASEGVDSAPSITPSNSVSEESVSESLTDSSSINSSISSSNYQETFGYEIGVHDLSDEELGALVERLKNDPDLLNDVLNELRAETDITRIKRLTALLGRAGGSEVLLVAEELAYSTSLDTRKAGLDLLSRVASENPQAYDIALNILSSEAEPEMLVSTMNVLATPSNASQELKANVVSQITPLTDHASAAVRRTSISLLPRLSSNPSIAPILTSALSDSDSKVKSSAAYAFGKYPFQPPEAVEGLLTLLENPDETKGVRRAAIYALESKDTSDETKSRISAARKQISAAARAGR